MRRIFLYLILVSLLPLAARGQFRVKDTTVAFSAIAVTGAYQTPAGDMGDRFGDNFAVGISFFRKTATNWIWGFEGSYFFGGAVNENTILSDISTREGYVIGADGSYADVFLHERGYCIFAKGGRIFPVIGPNPNSGILATLGAGFMQHKIFIEDKGNTAPQLSDEYRKGYDRLTNGLCLSQFAGYVHFSNSRRLNFYAGIEAMEGFTQNRRTINFDTGLHDDKHRSYILIGIRIGWIIPLYKKMPKEIYYD